MNIKKTLDKAIAKHQNNNLKQAEILYRSILDVDPNHLDTNNNLGVLLNMLDKLDEAEAFFKKAIELKPDYAEAYNNLGIIFLKYIKDNEAEKNYKKAIEFERDSVKTDNSLGVRQKVIDKLDEAESCFKKAIELKPDYAEAYNNLGIIFLKCKKINEAEKNYKKAIELKPKFLNAHENLKFLFGLKELLLKINKSKILKKKNEIKQDDISIPGSTNKSILHKFISNRTVEPELISKLYEIKTTELNKMKTGPFFGNGTTSNFFLFKEKSSIIQNLEKGLIEIMSQAVKSEVYIMDSFFNIMNAGGGSNPHRHINESDEIYGLSQKKYSLQYYLSVGDQNCKNPGFFEMKDPDEKILPSNGMIVIIPADRLHSAIYNGIKERVMIGVNFYSII